MEAFRSNNKSGWIGVYANGSGFQAKIMKDGKQLYLGNFDTPEEAACAYAKAYTPLRGPPWWMAQDGSINMEAFRTNNKTGWKYVAVNGNRFQARICKDGKLVSLGNFDTPEEAARAYAEAYTGLHGAPRGPPRWMAQDDSVDMQLGRAALNKEAEATRLPNTRTTAPLSSSETPRVTDEPAKFSYGGSRYPFYSRTSRGQLLVHDIV